MAEDSNLSDQAELPKEVGNLVIEPLLDRVAELAALPAKLLIKNPSAEVIVQENASLVGSGPIGIYASAEANATGVAIGSAFSVGYGQAMARAEIDIEAGVVIDAGAAVVV